jgi:hypothetical protein
MLLQITAPHFVAGIVVQKRPAPILSYMRGWDLFKIIAYCNSKGWSIESLD